MMEAGESKLCEKMEICVEKRETMGMTDSFTSGFGAVRNCRRGVNESHWGKSEGNV